jgi:beta-phosphoglucomutase
MGGLGICWRYRKITVCLLFDMDGLLVDTEPIMARSVMLALADQGVYLHEQDYYDNWTRKGKGIVDYMKGKDLTLDIEKYRSVRNKTYLDFLKTNIPLMSGTKETIAELSKTYKLGLVSSSIREFVHTILKSTDLMQYFSTIITAEDVEREKPAPDGFLLAAKILRTDPKECIVIEDAEKGVIAAKAAGMKVIAIPNAKTNDNDFSNADLKLENLKSLIISKNIFEIPLPRNQLNSDIDKL